MEQGFNDVCVAYCLGQVPVARVAQTCRSAAIEMPRPTVRKWCEHGYNQGYKKTLMDLKDHFKEKEAPKPTVNAQASEPEAVKEEVAKEEEVAEEEEPVAAKVVVATIPVTLNEDETYDLVVTEGQNVEDAVVSFCRKHVAADVAACIRQLLPDVLERYNASQDEAATTGLRGAEAP